MLDELRASGAISPETRRRLAAEAFSHTAAYEAAIATWFHGREAFPERLVVSLEKVQDLTYGENPHQRGAYYAERGARRHLLSRVEQLHGKELSFNNLNDLSGARALAARVRAAGVRDRQAREPVRRRRRRDDRGGVRQGARVRPGQRVRRRRRPQPRGRARRSGEKLAEQFVEVLFAPGYDDEALAALRQKKNTRILLDSERRLEEPGRARATSASSAGCSSRTPTPEIEDRDGWDVVAGELERGAVGRHRLRVARVQARLSNAIVLAKDLQTIGIGAGQMSRVDAVRIAVEKAAEFGHDPPAPSLASDAFFPFADGPQLALDAGVTAIVQPGGSTPRRRGRRRRERRRRRDGLHEPPPLPPLTLASRHK